MTSRSKKRELPIPTTESSRWKYHRSKSKRQRADQSERWNSLLIPNTQVLRNKLVTPNDPWGTTDPQILANTEEQISLRRLIKLQNEPIPGKFDLDHMKKIHRYLLGNIYEWAGTTRDVDMNKRGPDGNTYSYASNQDIKKMWAFDNQTLTKQGFLQGISNQSTFADHLSRHWGFVNHAHAFREGNTRSQMAFFHQLSDQAGWKLDVARFSPHHPDSVRDQFIAARFHYQSRSRDHRPLAQALKKALSPKGPEVQTEIHRDTPQQNTQRESAPTHQNLTDRSLWNRLRRPGSGSDKGPSQDGPEL